MDNFLKNLNDTSINTMKNNQYDEFSIKELAEQYYGKSFEELENVICEKEISIKQVAGEEVW